MECFAHLRLIPLPFATLQVKVENFSRDPESIKVARMVKKLTFSLDPYVLPQSV